MMINSIAKVFFFLLLTLNNAWLHAENKVAVKQVTNLDIIKEKIQKFFGQWESNDHEININDKYEFKAMPRFILHGPTGTGKSSTAQEVARHFNVPYFHIKCPTLVNSYQNSGAENIEMKFKEIVDVVEYGPKQPGEETTLTIPQRKGSMPVVVHLDEIDAIASTKFREKNAQSSAYKALDVFLDVYKNYPIIIIATTNCPDELPAELISRLHNKIEFKTSDMNSQRQILLALLLTECQPHIDERFLFERIATECVPKILDAKNIIKETLEAIQNNVKILNSEPYKYNPEIVQEINLLIEKTIQLIVMFRKDFKDLEGDQKILLLACEKKINQYIRRTKAFLKRYILATENEKNLDPLIDVFKNDLRLLANFADEIIAHSMSDNELTMETIKIIAAQAKTNEPSYFNQLKKTTLERLKVIGKEIERGIGNQIGTVIVAGASATVGGLVTGRRQNASLQNTIASQQKEIEKLKDQVDDLQQLGLQICKALTSTATPSVNSNNSTAPLLTSTAPVTQQHVIESTQTASILTCPSSYTNVAQNTNSSSTPTNTTPSATAVVAGSIASAAITKAIASTTSAAVATTGAAATGSTGAGAGAAAASTTTSAGALAAAKACILAHPYVAVSVAIASGLGIAGWWFYNEWFDSPSSDSTSTPQPTPA